jgi:hypothetical protein
MTKNFQKRNATIIIILFIFLSVHLITIPMMTGKLIGVGGLRGRGNLYWSDSEKIMSLKKEIPTELWNQYVEASIKTGTILEFVLCAICLVTLLLYIRVNKLSKN